MKEQIIAALEDPKRLEALYREDKASFRKSFAVLSPSLSDNKTIQIWHERLNFDNGRSSTVSKDLPSVLVLCLIAGLIAKIPHLTSVAPEYFYPRNISFVVFPALTAFFIWKQHSSFTIRQILGFGVALLIPAIYINLLPGNENTDTFILACMHLPMLLWGILGFVFIGGQNRDYTRKIDFLRFNGDFLVMTGLILIAGFIMTGMTIGLFSVIGIKIETYYFKYVAIWGLSAAPVIATYLVHSNPTIVGKVPPVIARIFTPIVLVILTIYLGTVFYTGKDPYNDREFLLIFNLLLVGVMALILFSIIEIARKSAVKTGTIILFALAVITVIVNSVALSAILFRIASWGITPNRLAVMGSNMLILAHLLVVTYHLFKTISAPEKIEHVKKSIVAFLPIYLLWAIFIIFALPYLFGFK